MATQTSANVTAEQAAAAKAGSYVADSVLEGGRLKVYRSTITLDGAASASDILEMDYLPGGVTLIPDLSTISTDGAGAGTLTLKVGTDTVKAGISVSSAGNALLSGTPLKTEERSLVTFLCAGANTDAKTITLNLVCATGQ